jgi:hypothetical protein
MSDRGVRQARLERAAEVMANIREDCRADAALLDETPFTPRGVGERLGAMLAMIDAVAAAVLILADGEDIGTTSTAERSSPDSTSPASPGVGS